MARLFDDALSQFLSLGSAVVTAPPFTLSAWAEFDAIAANTGVIGVGDASSTRPYYLLMLGSGDECQFQARDDAGGFHFAQSSSDISVNTLHHMAAVVASSSSRSVYLDGGNKDTDSDDITITAGSIDQTIIGKNSNNQGQWYMSGSIAEGAIWSAALTDAEIASLAARASPLLVRPQSLVSYWKLIRDEDQDIVGGFDMTANGGPTIASHPPMIYPAQLYIGIPVGAAPPAGIEIFRRRIEGY